MVIFGDDIIAILGVIADSSLNCFLFAGRKLFVLGCMQTHQNAERTLI